MLVKALLSVSLIALCAYPCDTIYLQRWHDTDENSQIVSFAVLNYNRLLVELNTGEGEYIDSLLGAMPSRLTKEQKLHKLKELSKQTKNAYSFATSIMKD